MMALSNACIRSGSMYPLILAISVPSGPNTMVAGQPQSP